MATDQGLNRFGLPPPKFDGKHASFDSFEMKFRAYMSVFHQQYNEFFRTIEGINVEITDALFKSPDGTTNNDAIALSHQLRWILLNVCEGGAEAVIRSRASEHGFELWRLLKLRYGGSNQMSALSVLTKIVQKKFNMNDFENDLANFEKMISDFERLAGEPLQTFEVSGSDCQHEWSSPEPSSSSVRCQRLFENPTDCFEFCPIGGRPATASSEFDKHYGPDANRSCLATASERQGQRQGQGQRKKQVEVRVRYGRRFNRNAFENNIFVIDTILRVVLFRQT